jgi:HEAT repeat protein
MSKNKRLITSAMLALMVVIILLPVYLGHEKAISNFNLEARCRKIWEWGQRGTHFNNLLRLTYSSLPFYRLYALQALGDFKTSDPKQALEVHQRLTAALSDPCPMVAVKALQKIAERDDKAALPNLKMLLNSSDSRVLLRTVYALGVIGDEASTVKLSKILNDPRQSDDVRMLAAEALGKLKLPSAVPALIKVLSDPDGYIKWKSAWALGQIRDKTAVPALIKSFNDVDSDVRRESALALGEIGDSRAVNFLIRGLKDPDDFVKRSSSEALQLVKGRLAFNLSPPPPGRESLQAEFKKAYIIKAGDSQNLSAVPVIITYLTSPDGEVKKVAAGTLGRLKARKAVPALIKALLTDSDPDFKGALLRNLGLIGNPGAIPAVLNSLNSSDSDLRLEAAKALGKLKAASAVPGLLKLYLEPDYKLKIAVINSLGEIGTKAALPGLITALSDPTAALRILSASALQNLNAPEAIPALLQNLHNPDPLTAYAAAQCLLNYNQAGLLSSLELEALKTYLQDADPLKALMRKCLSRPSSELRLTLEQDLAFISANLIKEEEFLTLRYMFNPVTQEQEYEKIQQRYLNQKKYHPDSLWEWEVKNLDWD